jgi:hypothetical protein
LSSAIWSSVSCRLSVAAIFAQHRVWCRTADRVLHREANEVEGRLRERERGRPSYFPSLRCFGGSVLPEVLRSLQVLRRS